MKVRKSPTVTITMLALVVAATVPAGQRVFVSSRTTLGDFGGLAGADAWCRHLPHDAGLGGLWVAWLSDSTTHARDRINGDGPFLLTDGTLIASDRADLLDENLDFPIDLDEYGNPPPLTIVETGTLANGYRYNGATTFCSDWTSSDPSLIPVGFTYASNNG